MNSSSLIEVQDLQLLDIETRNPICEPVNFQVRAGEIKLLTGANGVGKSSLLRAIFRNETKSPSLSFLGRIRFTDRDLVVRFHPQASALQFAIPVTLGDVQSWTSNSSLQKSRLLEGIDLSRPWDSASGGEKQRLLLSSLLISDSKIKASEKFEVLLLDEPTNHLDKRSRQVVADEVRSWIQFSPQTRAAIIASHDVTLFRGDTVEIVSTR